MAMQQPAQLHDPALLAAGYALGILTDQEEADYQRFFDRHPEAREQARAFSRVIDMLHADQPMVAPPAELRRRVLARIAKTPQLH
jgi:anti-sigma-K factor RskA